MATASDCNQNAINHHEKHLKATGEYDVTTIWSIQPKHSCRILVGMSTTGSEPRKKRNVQIKTNQITALERCKCSGKVYDSCTTTESCQGAECI